MAGTMKMFCMEHFFPWEKESVVPAMQHGCRAKPLFALSSNSNTFSY